MDINSVDAAEKEASEVLHSLLSVERIEKPIHELGHVQQHVVLLNSNDDGSCQPRAVERQQWNILDQAVFGNYPNNEWGSTYSLKIEKAIPQEQTIQLLQGLSSVRQETEESYHVQNNERNNDSHHQITKKTGKVIKRIRKRYIKDIAVQNNENTCEELEGSAQEVRERFKLGCECQDDCCFAGLNPENVYKHRLNIAELTKEEHDMYLMGVTMACMADPGVTAKQRIRRRLRAQYVYQGRRVCLSAFLYLENCTLYQLKRIRKHVMTHGVAPRVHGNHGKKPHNVFSLETYRRATDFLKRCISEYGIAPSNSKAPVLFPADFTRKTIHDMYKQMLIDSGPPGQKVMGYTSFRHFMKVQFPHVRFCKVDSGMGISAESKSAIAKTVTNIINSSMNNNNNSSSNNNNNNNNSSSSQNNNCQQQQQQQQQQVHQTPQVPQQQPPPHVIHESPTQQQQPVQHTLMTTNYITNSNADEQRSISLSTQSAASTPLTPDNMSHSTCPVSVSSSAILSPTQVATIPVILSEPNKTDLSQQQTAFIVTPVSQLVQPFQAGHAITVTPISNTAYAFATL